MEATIAQTRHVETAQWSGEPMTLASLRQALRYRSIIRGSTAESGRVLGEKHFKLTHREDLAHRLADLAKRHCGARARHSAGLRAIEGDGVFKTLTTYRAVAERLAREGRLAHVLFVAEKQA